MKHFFPSTYQNKAGFTILELLIFMALFSVLLVTLTSLFGATMEQQLSTRGISAVESDSSFVLARLQYDMERATQIITPSASGIEENTLELLIDGQTNAYTFAGGILTLTTPEGTFRLNSDGTVVSTATFRRLGMVGGKPTVLVTIRFASAAETRDVPETTSITTTLGLR